MGRARHHGGRRGSGVRPLLHPRAPRAGLRQPRHPSGFSGTYFNLVFNDLTVVAGTGGAPQAVTLTTTFVADGGPAVADPDGNVIFQFDVPSGWSGKSGPDFQAAIVWTSATTVSPTTPVSVQSSSPLLGPWRSASGEFTFTATAPGYEPATARFHTGAWPVT